MDNSAEWVEAAPTPALPAFPVLNNAAYNELPVKPGVNGSAIAAFLLGLCGIPIAIIFGVRALMQISDNPQKGRGWAIAGLCLCLLWWLAVLVLRLAY